VTRVLLLTRYTSRGASSRLRTLQYVDALSQRGIEFEIDSLLDDAYLDALYGGRRIRWDRVARAYARRAGLHRRLQSFDVVWLEKEAFPWLPFACERWLVSGGPPLVVDYDDAIFHRYDQHSSASIRRLLGTKIDRVMRSATVVVAGNEYLAERARGAGAERIEIIPTAVDLERYRPRDPAPRRGPFTVGWIGTPQTAHFLTDIAPALARFAANGDVRFVFVGCPADLDLGIGYQARAWSEATEAAAIRSFDVGLMPLRDAPFERGKCGYKLIQYMACAVPVIASPVGVNRQIVTPGSNGYVASTEEDWLRALTTLYTDESLGLEMGRRGRQLVEIEHSTRSIAGRLEAILRMRQLRGGQSAPATAH
jgi:glycosyltransferase involved in cell wall biosynthesis